MKQRSSTQIALLRGINVGGHNKIKMAELRSLCGEIGWADTQSYIQSGNLVFSASGKRADLEAELERRIEDRFGLAIPVIVRAATDWSKCLSSNPFPEASAKEPNHVLLLLSKARPQADVVAELRARATGGELIERAGDALWVHFGGGVAGSKLTAALLDRLVGSTVTSRNWRTVLKLAEMAD